MDVFPEMGTRQLLLRAFAEDDAETVVRLAGEREIAATTIRIPHPYEPETATAWIAGHQQNWQDDKEFCWAVVRRMDSELTGAISLMNIDRDHEHAELGYWVGRPFWGAGFATEAARVVLEFGFTALNLRRIHAHCFAGNPGSSRVLEKIGMQREGLLRQHIHKWDQIHDIELFGILVGEWRNP